MNNSFWGRGSEREPAFLLKHITGQIQNSWVEDYNPSWLMEKRPSTAVQRTARTASFWEYAMDIAGATPRKFAFNFFCRSLARLAFVTLRPGAFETVHSKQFLVFLENISLKKLIVAIDPSLLKQNDFVFV